MKWDYQKRSRRMNREEENFLEACLGGVALALLIGLIIMGLGLL